MFRLLVEGMRAVGGFVTKRLLPETTKYLKELGSVLLGRAVSDGLRSVEKMTQQSEYKEETQKADENIGIYKALNEIKNGAIEAAEKIEDSLSAVLEDRFYEIIDALDQQGMPVRTVKRALADSNKKIRDCLSSEITTNISTSNEACLRILKAPASPDKTREMQAFYTKVLHDGVRKLQQELHAGLRNTQDSVLELIGSKLALQEESLKRNLEFFKQLVATQSLEEKEASKVKISRDLSLATMLAMRIEECRYQGA